MPMCMQLKWDLYIFLCSFTILYISYLKSILCESVPCGVTYLAKNGKQCYPCEAGYSFVSDCVIDDEQSRCRPCGEGEYMPTCDNSSKCEICDKFCPDRRQEVVETCTTTSNLKCQCMAGFYWKQHSNIPNDGVCAKHSQCKIGEGVYRKGSPFEDTKCEPCVKGKTFSNSTSFDVCLACSVHCNITLRQCNVTHDAVCKSMSGTNPDIDGINKDDGDKSLVTVAAVLSSGTVVIVVVVVAVILYIRRRKPDGSHSDDRRMDCYVNMESGHTSENLPNSSLTLQQQNGVSGREDSRNGKCNTTSTNNKVKKSPKHNPLSYHKKREEDIPENIKDIEHTEAHDKDIENSEAHDNSGFSADTTHAFIGIADTSEKNNAKSENRILNVKFVSKQRADVQNGSEQKPEESKDCEYIEGTPLFESNVSNTKESNMIANIDVSTDAGHVSPRIVQRVSSSIDNNCDKRNVTNESEAPSETECSHSIETETVLQPDGSYGQTDNGTQRPYSNRTADKSDTNSEAISTVDADIDHALKENDKDVKETIYQLMNMWRQKNPQGTRKNIVDALKKCKENLTSEQLITFMNSLEESDTGVVNADITSDFVQDNEEPNFPSELITSAGINENIQGHFQQAINHEMLELKEVHF